MGGLGGGNGRREVIYLYFHLKNKNANIKRTTIDIFIKYIT